MKTRLSFWGKAVTVAFLVLALGVLFSCDTSTNGGAGEFSGKWVSDGGDQFIIDKEELTFTYWNPSYSSMDYTGTIVGDVAKDLSLLKQESGYIALKITKSGSYGPTKGKYFRIHWKGLTDSSVDEAGAYKTSGSNNSGMDTLAAAVAEYTVENGYFDMFGTYSPAP